MKRSLQTLKPEEVNHNALKPISREEMELICNDDEEDALDIEENLETEEDALDMEENLEIEEDEDHVAEALGSDQPLKDFIDLQKENKRLKSENMALVEELKKMRETMQKNRRGSRGKNKRNDGKDEQDRERNGETEKGD